MEIVEIQFQVKEVVISIKAILLIMQLYGLLLMVGMACLYAHLQKSYAGVRPWLLQFGCMLPAFAGFIAFMIPFTIY